jgi:glycosyltransferase involved in cell wall biosynthesis
MISNSYPESFELINSKIEVLHPAQSLIVNEYSEKNIDNEFFVFTIIGADFFRKGGLQVLRVFEKLREKNVKLNIVSTLQYGLFATWTTSKEYEEAIEIINSNNNIYHYKVLENGKVLDLLKRSHVCLLPTFSDTYGFSVLEAQASGCPVITTNIRALPEINNQEVGWLIDVPRDAFGSGLLSSKEESLEFGRIVEQELYRIIDEEILSNVEVIKAKGQKALERIRKEHNPKDKAKFLEEVYKNAIESINK